MPQKDLGAVDEFVSNLEAIYYVALDTSRAGEFERKSLFESILINKLPQFKHKWITKWSRNEEDDGASLTFLDFLAYLKTAIRIARNVNRCELAAREPKRVEESRNGGARDPSSFQSGRISGREFPLLRPTYLENGENPIHEKRNDETSVSRSQKRGDDLSTSQNAHALARSRSEEDVEAKSESYCAICEMPHALTSCQAFLASSADDRATLCRNKNLCFKCLKPGHVARTCSSRVRCIVCGGSHHGSLHVDAPSTFTVKAATPSAPQESA